MDIEEIKCPLCGELFDEQEKAPILLPDCGHSYCFICINKMFDTMREEQAQFDLEYQIKIEIEKQTQQFENDDIDDQLNDNNDDYLQPNRISQDLEDLKNDDIALNAGIKKQIALFRCPDDDVVCSIQKAEMLPKNYALLKIIQKATESINIKKNKIVKLDFQMDQGQFIVSRPEDNSLANFLTSDSPSKQNKKQEQNDKLLKQKTKSYDEDYQQIQQQQKEQFITPQIIEQDQPQSKTQTPVQIPPLNFQQQLTPQPFINQQQELLSPHHQEQPQLENCAAHGRPAELICVDDKIRICHQCALFGTHKGHDVRMEEDVTKEISLKVEVIMEMYQAMENSCDELNIQDNYEKHYNIFKAKQNEMKEKIQDKFKEWRRALRAVEMKAIDSLYVNFQQFEDKFQQAKNHNNKLIGEAHTWMDKAKQQLDDYTNKTLDNPFYIPYELIDNSKSNVADDILSNGEHLLEKTEKQKGFPSLNNLDQTYSAVKVSFDPSVEKKLQNIAKVYSSNGQNQHDMSEDFTTNSGSFLPPFSYNEEEDFNDGIKHVKQALANDALNLSNISFNEPASPINNQQTIQRPPPLQDLEETKEKTNLSNNNNETVSSSNNTTVLSSGNQTNLNNQSSLSQSKLRRFSTLKPPTGSSQSSAQKNSMNAGERNVHSGTNSQMDLQTLVPPTPANQTSNSKKKNDLPTTFKNDSNQGDLDLSNRNMSDMHSNELAKCIRTLSGGVRSLNMSKNRISDDGILHIIKALCDSQIEQVNLQGNKLSEKCVEGIVGCLKTNKTLKLLDLSNNGISSRLMKNKLKNGLPQIDVIV